MGWGGVGCFVRLLWKEGRGKKVAMWIGSGTGLCSHRGSAECVPVGFIKGVPLKQTETHLQNPCDSKISFQNPAPLQLGEKKEAVGDEQIFSQILSQLLEHSWTPQDCSKSLGLFFGFLFNFLDVSEKRKQKSIYFVAGSLCTSPKGAYNYDVHLLEAEEKEHRETQQQSNKYLKL